MTQIILVMNAPSCLPESIKESRSLTAGFDIENLGSSGREAVARIRAFHSYDCNFAVDPSRHVFQFFKTAFVAVCNPTSSIPDFTALLRCQDKKVFGCVAQCFGALYSSSSALSPHCAALLPFF